MIVLEHVSKTYHDSVHALKDVSLHIKKGECCFVVGPSGAGKTTLFKLLYAMERPTAGSVYLHDRDICTLNERDVQAMRRGMGFVFQDFKLINDWTVYDNTAIMLQILYKPSIYIRSRVWKMLKWVGLQHKVYEKAGNLSGGERQRLALVRSIIHDPDIIIADEPLESLDEEIAGYIMDVFCRLKKKGTTIVFAGHKQDTPLDYSRLIFMDKGVILND